MRLNRFVTLGKIVLGIAILFCTQLQALAQSATSVITHYVEVTPGEDGISYDIHVYFTVLDGSGNLIRQLTDQDLTIAENGQKVEIERLGVITEEPINVVLVMDTSETMYGPSIMEAKVAAISFVQGLMKPSDQAAILTFDDNVRTHVNFTGDQKTITDGITRIEARRETGSCLYDSAYAAVEALSQQKLTGSRAVILFTDGRDETHNKAICSAHSVDEVIQLASAGEMPAPIYTIGLGINSDTKTLENISNRTGGVYLYASTSTRLANVFQTLSEHLRSQYVLTYRSTLTPGIHTLTVNTNQPVGPAQDTHDFLLPSLPARMTFITPLDGETINELLNIEVSLETQEDIVIEKVAFVVNGAEAGTDDTKPYQLTLDAKQYSVGAMTLTAIAYEPNGMELARRSINLFRAESPQVPTIAPAQVESTPATFEPAKTTSPVVYMAILLSGLSITAIIFLLSILLRQQKQAKLNDVDADYDNDISTMQSIPIYRRINDIRKADRSEVEPGALGALIIEFSDDSSLVGQRFEITTPFVTLGRSADNDIHFPNDKPVSRHHAEIYQSSDKLYLREVEAPDAAGAARSPKYGTYLNQEAMGTDPALLKTGDEIQLGKRLRLRFESYTQSLDADMLTYDDMTNTDDYDRTQENNISE
jgi:VWFA-related protein